MNFWIFMQFDASIYLMSVFTSEEVSKKLEDFGIIMKYMPFLQEHGFSEFGKGQLAGKMELLKEGLSDSTTNQSGRQFDSRMRDSHVNSSFFHDYEEPVVGISSATSIEASPNLEDRMNMGQNFDEVEKTPGGIKTSERAERHKALGHSGKKNYLLENNRWNYKSDDESSWITRIRKLADM
jgi:hypothetical protein